MMILPLRISSETQNNRIFGADSKAHKHALGSIPSRDYLATSKMCGQFRALTGGHFTRARIDDRVRESASVFVARIKQT